MAKTPKPEPVSQKRPINAEVLINTGELLAKYAEQFVRLGQFMKENGLAPITVRGADGVQEFLTRLDNYYGNCSSELGFLKIGEPRLAYKVQKDGEVPPQ